MLCVNAQVYGNRKALMIEGKFVGTMHWENLNVYGNIKLTNIDDRSEAIQWTLPVVINLIDAKETSRKTYGTTIRKIVAEKIKHYGSLYFLYIILKIGYTVIKFNWNIIVSQKQCTKLLQTFSCFAVFDCFGTINGMDQMSEQSGLALWI